MYWSSSKYLSSSMYVFARGTHSVRKYCDRVLVRVNLLLLVMSSEYMYVDLDAVDHDTSSVLIWDLSTIMK